MKNRPLVLIALACLTFSFPLQAHAQSWKLKAEIPLPAGTPLILDVPNTPADPEISLKIVSDRGDVTPANFLPSPFSAPEQGEKAAWCVVGILPQPWQKGEIRTLTLQQDGTNRILQKLAVWTTKTDDHPVPDKSLGDFATYRAAQVEAPTGTNPLYTRSGYLHPLKTPSGLTVSGDLSPDHYHQRGVFFAWTKTEFANRSVDFWNLQQGKGRTRHDRFLGERNGRLSATLDVQLAHEVLNAEMQPEGVPLLDHWRITAYELAPNSPFRILDLTSRQMVSTPIKLPQYHYGAFGIRASNEWAPPEEKVPESWQPPAHVLTSEGHDRLAGNAQKATWAAFHGPLNTQQGPQWAGIAAISHPRNFRHPQPMRIHPQMPYFCFFPPIEGDMELKPGQPYESRYRLVLFDGKIQPEILHALSRAFAGNALSYVTE